jgi:hypothetical protein
MAVVWFASAWAALALACGGSPLPSGEATTSTSSEVDAGSGCPAAVPRCLAWDDFDTTDGEAAEAATGQSWTTEGLFCESCHPSLSVMNGRAALVPATAKNFIWLATMDTGASSGIVVSAEITLSPTKGRANVGLVALYADRRNHLTCKIEVTEGNPDGLLAIGDQMDGHTTSLLADRGDVGLKNGETYRLELAIPSSVRKHPVRCSVSGPSLDRTAVAVRLMPDRIAAYGDGSSQGIRIKIYDDEDDGLSTWGDFLVRPA